MKTKLKKAMRKESDAIGAYSHEYQDKDFHNGFYGSNYEYATWLNQSTVYELNTMETSGQLDHLKKEILIRIKITKSEIFKIGELLCRAKKICRVNKIRFQKWITQNFDFSYETAVNFMNVHKNCLGHRKFAEKIPTTILYKITSPSFPDELRDYLFEKGNMEKMTNGKLKDIWEKYKAEGIGAIEKDLERLNDIHFFYNQVNYRIDLLENYLRNLNELRTKFLNKQQKGFYLEFDSQVEGLTKEAAHISKIMYDGIEESYSVLEQALKEATQKSNEFRDDILKNL